MKNSKPFEKEYRCTLEKRDSGYLPYFESRYYAQKFIDDRISPNRSCIIGKTDKGYIIYDIHMIVFSKEFFN